MYENVEIDLNDTNQISTDEILRLYENDNNVEESCNVQKSTRKVSINMYVGSAVKKKMLIKWKQIHNNIFPCFKENSLEIFSTVENTLY